jgi:hypothetical protein
VADLFQIDAPQCQNIKLFNGLRGWLGGRRTDLPICSSVNENLADGALITKYPPTPTVKSRRGGVHEQSRHTCLERSRDAARANAGVVERPEVFLAVLAAKPKAGLVQAELVQALFRALERGPDGQDAAHNTQLAAGPFQMLGVNRVAYALTATQPGAPERG